MDQLLVERGEFDEKEQRFEALNPKLRRRRGMESKEILELFSNPHLLPFLTTIRKIRNERMLERRQQANSSVKRKVPTVNILEEAGIRLQLDLPTQTALGQAYTDIIELLCSGHNLMNDRIKRNTEIGETREDIIQSQYLDLVDAVAAFPYWETIYLDPDLTLKRLNSYVAMTLYGYTKGTDATRVSHHIGENKDGEDLSFDLLYQARGVDTEETVLSTMSYEELRNIILEETQRLGLDPLAPEILQRIIEGETIKSIAATSSLSAYKIGRMILKLREAVAQRIQPERAIRKERDLSPVWQGLTEPPTIEHLRQKLETYPLRDFHRRVLELTIQKAEDLLAADSMDVSEVRKEVIKYVARHIQEESPNVSRDIRVVEDTVRRHIQKTWNLFTGAEIYEARGQHRTSANIRQAETKSWRSFVAANPNWTAFFPDVKDQEIIKLYYLENSTKLNMEEIGRRVGLHGSRVSRRLERLAQQRINMEHHRSLRQL